MSVAAAMLLLSAGCGGNDHDGHDKPAPPKANAADRAFAELMVPHHEAALPMAELARQRAEHPEVRKLGGQIIKTQTAEIAELRRLGKEAGVKPTAQTSGHGGTQDYGPAASALGLTEAELAIEHETGGLKTAKPFDRAFIDAMAPHHQGAIRMAQAELARGADPRLKALARRIVAAQMKEVTQMNAWRTDWYGKPAASSGKPAGEKEPSHEGGHEG